MKVYPDKLGDHLRGDLAPVYLVSGDEPLQAGECADMIREAARKAGHSTREVIEVDSGFDWQRLANEATAMSLFAEKKIIDLRIPGGKPGNEGGKAISAYCDNPPPDTLLLISLPKLDRQQQGSKWFKAVNGIGAVIQVWPVDVRQMPRWIEQRLRAAGIAPGREVVQILADRAEGNLLAAAQEIQKLVLLRGEGDLDEAELLDAIADSARYDVFELIDSALRRQAGRCLHMIEGLRGEGVAAPVVLWALHRESRTLAQISADIAKGMTAEHAVSRARVFSKRTTLVREAVGNLRTPQWLGLLRECHQADRAIKGALAHDPWLLIERIVLAMCGQPHPPARDT
ncbi:MAG: DNA polymerase III subunit delta [Gammaproteobacteria bacterium]|nr:DNA polymerase III subunit delta [Gammaproteobacteria bacterium]